MGIISEAMRKKLPSSEFGIPAKRKYPLDTTSRAIDAKGRATQMVKKGKLSKSAEAKIDAKANKVINKNNK
jgi:hypothetical protein